MSFSSEIKEELSKVSNHNNNCCKLAELAGYLITNCNIVRDKDRFVLKMVTSSSSAIRRVYNAFRKIYGVIPITNIEKKEEGKEQLYELIVSNSDDLEKIFKNSLVNIDVNLQIVIDDGGRIKEKECCMRSFLRGVFLGSGSINEPVNGNHLELVIFNAQNTNFINGILAELGISAKMMKRKKSFVIYIKDAETISDFLKVIGSNKGIILFEQTKVEKEYRNNMNRRINCEVANMDKIAVAASEQLKDIMLLKEKKLFQKLPANLKQIANLRIKYPEASLDKIGDMLDVKLSRSGVSHRFKKIKEIANEVRNK